LKSFGNSAKELSRNPLGIIALFIVLVYGFACLLFGFSAKNLTTEEKSPLIWFTVLFPVLVLFVFAWLVTKHHNKLYSPRDFRDDDAFLNAMRENQNKPTKAKESTAEIKDLMEYGAGFNIIKYQEKAIRDDFDKRKINYSGETAKVLIHQLAASQVLQWFERTYPIIFGSQIALLKLLNVNPLGNSYTDVCLYYDKVKNKYPLEYSAWDVDQYLNYLFSSNLIVKDNETVKLTETGKEFLVLLTKSGYSELKRL